MGIEAIIAVLIPAAIKYGPVAVDALKSIIHDYRHRGELSEAAEAALLTKIAAIDTAIEKS